MALQCSNKDRPYENIHQSSKWPAGQCPVPSVMGYTADQTPESQHQSRQDWLELTCAQLHDLLGPASTASWRNNHRTSVSKLNKRILWRNTASPNSLGFTDRKGVSWFWFAVLVTSDHPVLLLLINLNLNLNLMLEPTTSWLWDPDWSHSIQTINREVSGLAQVEFWWSNSEFLAPGETATLTVLLRLSVCHFDSRASLQHVSALLVKMTCPVQMCYPWLNLKVSQIVHTAWYWIMEMIVL